MLLLFFERKCFVITLLVFMLFAMLFQFPIWNNVKIVMLFQFGIITLKIRKIITLLLTTECVRACDGPPASVYRHSPD